jgi:hypothetical protein
MFLRIAAGTAFADFKNRPARQYEGGFFSLYRFKCVPDTLPERCTRHWSCPSSDTVGGGARDPVAAMIAQSQLAAGRHILTTRLKVGWQNVFTSPSFSNGRIEQFLPALETCLSRYLSNHKRIVSNGLVIMCIPRDITLPSAHHSPTTVNKKASELVIGTVKLNSAIRKLRTIPRSWFDVS